jgi:hypothetical protein
MPVKAMVFLKNRQFQIPLLDLILGQQNHLPLFCYTELQPRPLLCQLFILRTQKVETQFQLLNETLLRLFYCNISIPFHEILSGGGSGGGGGVVHVCGSFGLGAEFVYCFSVGDEFGKVRWHC